MLRASRNPSTRSLALLLSALIAGAILLPGCGKSDPAESEASPSAPPEPEAPVASPLDGKGTASVEPAAPVRVSSPGTWTIRYVAGDTGIEPGGGIVLQISPFWGWTPPQVDSPQAPGYVSISTDDPGVELVTQAYPSQYWVQAIVKGDRPLPAGATVTFVYGDTSEGQYPTAAARADRFAERDEEFFLKVDGDGDGFYLPIADSPKIDILPGPAVRLLVTGPSLVELGEVFELRIAAVDARMNRAADFEGAILLKDLEPGIEHPAEVVFAPEDRGAVTVPARAIAEGKARILATRDEDDLAFSVSNPILVTSRSLEYRLYWGDFQVHSGLSDGSGMPEDILRYARDVAGLDAVSVTDHDAHGVFALDEAPEVWERMQRSTREAHEPGRFVPFLGYEWTSWEHGHKHVIYLDDDAPLISNRREAPDPKALWDRLEEGRALTIAHHTLGGPQPTDWDYHDDRFEPVVEICSIHGNSEGQGEPLAVTRPRPGSGVKDALARGYRLGFLGSGDTHNGHPGMGDPSAPLGGVAGIYARELTREAIFEALRARRVFASSGPRAVLDFTLNDAWMGSAVRIDDASARRRIHVEAYSPIRIEALEVIKNGERILYEPIDDLQFAVDLTDPEPAADGDYYYARIRILHDQMLWSSPIWIDLPAVEADGR